MSHDTLKILIADDDEGDRAHLRRCLERAELAYECTESTTIEHAIMAACCKSEFR